MVEVDDVATAAHFYRGLGLELMKESRWEGGDYAELSDPEGLKLVLIEGDGGIRLAFSVEDVGAALAGVAADGGSVQRGATPAGGGLWGTALDPWGNPLGFWGPAPSDER
ncbi:MAG: VOC family protein [Actinomycetota bacterium]|nr:VOC family protein [Actinomycetota bacterium]